MKAYDLTEYAEFMRKYGLDYLEAKKGDFHVLLKKQGAEIKPVEEISKTIASAEEILEAASKESQAVGNLVYIKAPLVGTFYGTPSPESAPFVEIGSKVKEGDTLCIIEAMKVMNEIKAEHSGDVQEILVENTKPVEYGQVLIVLQTAQGGS